MNHHSHSRHASVHGSYTDHNEKINLRDEIRDLKENEKKSIKL